MSDDTQIREKLAKIKALFAGATTPGERQAAQAAATSSIGNSGPSTWK